MQQISTADKSSISCHRISRYLLSKSFTILSSSAPEVPFFFFCFLLALAAVTLRLLLPESAIASKLRQIEGIVCRAASAPDLHGYTEKLIKGH